MKTTASEFIVNQRKVRYATSLDLYRKAVKAHNALVPLKDAGEPVIAEAMERLSLNIKDLRRYLKSNKQDQ